jgi:hypothetical protein
MVDKNDLIRYVKNSIPDIVKGIVDSYIEHYLASRYELF